MRSLSLAAMASLGVPISFVIAKVRMMASSGSLLLHKARSSYIEANQSQTLLLKDVTILTTDSIADFREALLSMRL